MTLFTETLPPADQPYAVPDNWVWVNLETFSSPERYSFVDGPFGSNLKTTDYTDSGIRLIQLQNIGDGHWRDENQKFISKEKAKELERCRTIPGDLVIAKMADPIARSTIVPDIDKEYIIVADCVKLSVASDFSKEYVCYCLNSPAIRNIADSLGRGSTRKRINLGQLKRLPFPLSPLPEQRRIAAKLDALLGKLREARTLMDEARASFALRRAAILHQAFSGKLTAQWRAEHPDITARSGGWFDEEIKETPFEIPETWKCISLGSVCRLKHGFAFKKDDYCEKGIPIIRISDIHDGRVSFEYAQNVPETLYDERFQVKKGDILIALSGATTGKNGVFYDDVFVMQNQRVGNLKISRPDILIEGYRNFFIQHSQTQILQLAYGGAQPNINADLIEGLLLPLPPFEEQREIVRQLDSLLGHETAAAALLDMDDELDLLEQSILSRAFRGELGTNDPAEPPAI